MESSVPTLAAPFPDSAGVLFDNIVDQAHIRPLGAGASIDLADASLQSRLETKTMVPATQVFYADMEDTSEAKTQKSGSQRRRHQPKGGKPLLGGDATQPESTQQQTEVKKRTKRAPKKPPAPIATEEVQSHDYSPQQAAGQDETQVASSQRHKILERNRVAATKCRRRKRSEASTLSASEQEMEERYRMLAATAEALKNEAYVLKTKLLQHTDCSCVLIQRYIANEAKKSVDMMEEGVGALSTGTYWGNGTSTSTPDWHGSSSTSTAADSTQMQSPITGVAGEGMALPWGDGFREVNKTIPAQLLDGYQQVPTMMPGALISPEIPMGVYGTPQQLIDTSEAQYPQQGFENNMIWNQEWHMG